MKKKNLNFLLALLAALALVFAGACSDGSDDDGDDTTITEQNGDGAGTGGNGGTDGSGSTPGSDVTPTDYAATYYSTTWTAEESIVRTNTNGGTVNVVAEDVSIEKATIAFGTSTSSATLTLVFTEEAANLAEDTYTQWTKALTISSWSADESGNVSITLPAGEDGSNVAGLNLTLSDSTLTLASVTYTANTTGTPTASYTVSLSDATSANGSTAGGKGDISTSNTLDIFSEDDIDGLGVFTTEDSATAFTKVTD